jgi:hypothetical protein
MKKKCPWHNKCRNGGDGCYAHEPENCVRFMPTDGTNLTEINGIIETPPEIDDDKFSQYFINWIESMGWSFCGSLNRYEEEKDDSI